MADMESDIHQSYLYPTIHNKLITYLLRLSYIGIHYRDCVNTSTYIFQVHHSLDLLNNLLLNNTIKWRCIHKWHMACDTLRHLPEEYISV